MCSRISGVDFPSFFSGALPERSRRLYGSAGRICAIGVRHMCRARVANSAGIRLVFPNGSLGVIFVSVVQARAALSLSGGRTCNLFATHFRNRKRVCVFFFLPHLRLPSVLVCCWLWFVLSGIRAYVWVRCFLTATTQKGK